MCSALCSSTVPALPLCPAATALHPHDALLCFCMQHWPCNDLVGKGVGVRWAHPTPPCNTRYTLPLALKSSTVEVAFNFNFYLPFPPNNIFSRHLCLGLSWCKGFTLGCLGTALQEIGTHIGGNPEESKKIKRSLEIMTKRKS